MKLLIGVTILIVLIIGGWLFVIYRMPGISISPQTPILPPSLIPSPNPIPPPPPPLPPTEIYYCHVGCTGQMPSDDVVQGCLSQGTRETCNAYISKEFPYRCDWGPPISECNVP
ncbi:MAG: hypothetical protein AAB783_01245 [Patescibacteria group bacterium]